VVGEEADGVRDAGLLAVLLLALAASSPRPAAAEDIAGANAEPWEHEVDRAVKEQDREIDAARLNKSMSSVVTRYASRVSRDATPLNYFLYGRALYYDGDPMGARQQMAFAVQANPAFWPAHMRLAMLLAELKNPREAERHLREVLARRPAYDPALRFATNLALETKDWARARRLLEDLIRRSPDDLELRMGLAKVHSETKDWPAAVEQLRILKAKKPADLDVAWLLGVALLAKGDVDGALVEFYRLAHGRPDDPRGWARLYEIHLSRKEWAKAADALQRLLPLLPADRRSEAGKVLQALRSGNPEAVGEEARAPSWKDVFARVESGEAKDRVTALNLIRQGLEAEVLDHVPQPVLKRVLVQYEPDEAARAVVVRILVRLGNPTVLPLLALALYDRSPRVRMLAAEGIGDLGQPAGVLYLFPQLAANEPAEYESVRQSLARLAEFDDRAGVPVGCAADVASSREAWRVWRLEDASSDVRLAAVRQFVTLDETGPERYLVEFVLDPTYEVMRESYVALRNAAARPPPKDDPLAVKMMPRFPRVPDAEVTRPSMRTIQDRVRAWWTEWLTERRALYRSSGR
jgi:Flp pilus assembly protein TadD